MLRFLIMLQVIAAAAFTPSFAHEYYLLPDTFSVNPGTKFNVRHRVGENFKGAEMPYISAWNVRSEIWEGGEKRKIKGRDGDRPALQIESSTAGLATIVHQSNVDFLTFKTWEKFEKYTKSEGISHALAPSVEGTKPKVGLREAYTRYAKTLVNFGGTTNGADTATGLKIELIALSHPGALTVDEKMPVQLLYNGKAMSGALVKIFIGVDTEPVHRIKTDQEGKVYVPYRGKGPYLLNAVHMTEPQSKEAIDGNAHWESFWASLTFKRTQ